MWGRDAKCSFKPHNQSPAESDGQQRILRLDWNRQRQAAVNEDREREITTTKKITGKSESDRLAAEQSRAKSDPFPDPSSLLTKSVLKHVLQRLKKIAQNIQGWLVADSGQTFNLPPSNILWMFVF